MSEWVHLSFKKTAQPTKAALDRRLRMLKQLSDDIARIQRKRK